MVYENKDISVMTKSVNELIMTLLL